MDLANTLRKKGYKHGFNCFLAKTHFYRYWNIFPHILLKAKLVRNLTYIIWLATTTILHFKNPVYYHFFHYLTVSMFDIVLADDFLVKLNN